MPKAKAWGAFALVAAVVAGGTAAWAEPTDITVHVISRGAKFIGTTMGGVLITLKDAETGELLAKGTTEGGTGDTVRIMKEKHGRGGMLSTESAAGFSTTIDLKRPRLIEVTAFGPLAQHQSANRVSAVQWVVPGKNLTGGDGWLLEMPGFIVDVIGPPTHQMRKGLPQTVEIKANVTLMCGCPVEPGGLWDSNTYEIKARIKRNGEPAGEIPLNYAGETSQFAGTFVAKEPGAYQATVYAYDPANGNTGVDATTFIVAE